MKIKFTLLAFTAFTGSLFAQPVIQSSNFISTGASATILAGPAVAPGSPGANQTWNFSSLSLTTAGSLTVIDPATSPFASTFPGANLCFQFTLPNGTQYSYQALSSSSIETLGDQITASSGDNYTPNPKTWFVFPFNYTQSFSDAWMRTTDVTTDTVIRTYDAYGTLILPFGTFNNVIRVTSSHSTSNTVWYNSNPVYPILQVEGSTSIAFSNVVLNVDNSASQEKINIYPNPATDLIKIDAGKKITACVAYASSGQQAELAVNPDNTVNIHHLAAGLYVMQVITDDGTIISKRIVKQ